MKKFLLGVILLGTFIAPMYSQAESKTSRYSYTPETSKVEVKETGELAKIEINGDSFIELDSVYKNETVVSSEGEAVKGLRGVAYGKTISITSSAPTFSSTVSYTKYDNTLKRWHSGTLQVRSSEYQDGKYVATYGGTLVMQIR